MDDLTKAVVDRLEGKVVVRFYDKDLEVVHEVQARVFEDEIECEVTATKSFRAYYTSVAPHTHGLARLTTPITVMAGDGVILHGKHPQFSPQ